MSDVQNRFVRVLVSGILGWLLTLAAMFLTTIGIDPQSETGQLVIAWLKQLEPILIVIFAAAANALIAKVVEKYPNLSWLERFLNPFNNRVPVYVRPELLCSGKCCGEDCKK
jgi:hypothetical protein